MCEKACPEVTSGCSTCTGVAELKSQNRHMQIGNNAKKSMQLQMSKQPSICVMTLEKL